VPEPDLAEMEPQVRESLQQRRSAVLENPKSADAWGRFGMVAHAHELWAEAEIAYRQAEILDDKNERWPYFLGDVLSVVGTDPVAAEDAFRRAMVLRPDYAPAHMRLGNVLVAADQSEKAASEFERALELAPDLQEARVPLAQIRLSQGELEVAEELLQEVLASSPRHGQALSTLGQVYMRQGRRDEARNIAQRARSAANYNLYSDPLMSEVVAEGVSAIQLWERAKSFLDNGNYEQAARGLKQVVELRPSNPDVHLQLAIAYGNLGNLGLSRHHLERSVELAPDLVDSRVRLATVLLELQKPAEAVPHLARVLELAPDDPDAGWLLGKAQVLAGDLAAGLASFAHTEAAALDIPAWAHNEYGRALAQAGRTDAALTHFRAALAKDPENVQALFFLGLVLEGLGRIDEAVEHYCRSVSVEANPPADTRLRELGEVCD
jgi:tetratricopeptide (TPR) repeat protein